MKKFAIELTKCVMITIALSGLAVVALVIIPIELIHKLNRSKKVCLVRK